MPNSTHLPTEKLALILVHGATLNGAMWDPVRRFLDPQLAVATPDLPGHGTRRDTPYTLPGAVQIIADTARSLHPTPVLLVGDSLGSYSSMAAAGALPGEQLKGLVLGGASFNVRGTQALRMAARGALMRYLAALFGEQRMIEKLMPKAFDAFKLSRDDGRRMIDSGMSIVAFGQAVKALRGVDFRAQLARIEQPVLIVNGDRDMPNVRGEPSFVAAARNASTHRFAECGHGVSLLRPREFADLINAFAYRVAS
jgi:pimeloyl-ACP methyl ester carboxylesterase